MLNIKDYINKALALEKAVYIQEKLIDRYTEILNRQQNTLQAPLQNVPVKPTKRVVNKTHVKKENVTKPYVDPEKYSVVSPTPPERPVLNNGLEIIGALGCLAFLVFFCLIKSMPLTLISLFASVYFIGESLLKRQEYKEAYIQYQKKLHEYETKKKKFPELCKQKQLLYENEVKKQKELYERKLKDAELVYEQELKKADDTYKMEMEKADTEYKNALALYNDKMSLYHKSKRELEACTMHSANLLREQNQLLARLKSALAEHYNSDILYPKYHYFVAVASISEYLSSGRCDTLEGANGAYNIYEAELRQNLIIGQLSSVLGDMDKIKTNQYLLYKELMDAENTVKELSKSRGLTPFGKNDPMYDNYVASTLKFIES